MNGKSERFRAKRMRLLMTMSDSGPSPRNHSPVLCVKSSILTLAQSKSLFSKSLFVARGVRTMPTTLLFIVVLPVQVLPVQVVFVQFVVVQVLPVQVLPV